MPQRVKVGHEQFAAVQDGVTLTDDQLADLGLLAMEIEECLPLLINGGVLGFVIRGIKVRVRFGRDTETSKGASP